VPIAAPVETLEGALFVHGRSPEGVREGVLFLALGGRADDAASIADACANGATLAIVHNAADLHSAAAPLYKLNLDHLLRRPLGWVRDCGVAESASATVDLETIAARAAERIDRTLKEDICL
jgi:Ser/Thr protein kinase RdoA (MazF antagonist)